MSDVFSTHTNDSYVWGGGCCVLVIQSDVDKMLSLSQSAKKRKKKKKKAFLFKWQIRKWKDNVKDKSNLFFVWCRKQEALVEWVHWPLSLRSKLQLLRGWSCSMNVNDISSVPMKKKNCLNKDCIYSVISDKALVIHCFHYCSIYQWFINSLKM